MAIPCRLAAGHSRRAGQAPALPQRQRDEEEAKKREIEGKKKKIEWGSQIRSYVLDDRRIKDHRTNYERFDVETVLDGDLDEFMEKYLSEFGD